MLDKVTWWNREARMGAIEDLDGREWKVFDDMMDQDELKAKIGKGSIVNFEPNPTLDQAAMNVEMASDDDVSRFKEGKKPAHEDVSAADIPKGNRYPRAKRKLSPQDIEKLDQLFHKLNQTARYTPEWDKLVKATNDLLGYKANESVESELIAEAKAKVNEPEALEKFRDILGEYWVSPADVIQYLEVLGDHLEEILIPEVGPMEKRPSQELYDALRPLQSLVANIIHKWHESDSMLKEFDEKAQEAYNSFY